MAFKEAGKGRLVQGTKMEIGESVTGYVLGFKKSDKYEQENILMKSKETGEKFTFFSAGNIKYRINDGSIEVGLLTRITRLTDIKVKTKKSSQFKIEQDADDKVEGAPAPVTVTANGNAEELNLPTIEGASNEGAQKGLQQQRA